MSALLCAALWASSGRDAGVGLAVNVEAWEGVSLCAVGARLGRACVDVPPTVLVHGVE